MCKCALNVFPHRFKSLTEAFVPSSEEYLIGHCSTRNICIMFRKRENGTLKRILNLIASGWDGFCMLGLFNTFMPKMECHALCLRYSLLFLFFLGLGLRTSDTAQSCSFLLAASKQYSTASICDNSHVSRSSSSSSMTN